MQKADLLRAALVAAIPLFAIDPDQLKIYVDEGRVIARRSKGLGFEYRYQLQVLVENVKLGPDDLFVPILLWLREHQPDLLLRFQEDASAIRFAADILTEDAWTIAIILELSEAVTVTPAADGSGWAIVHLPEPSPDDPLLPGARQDSLLTGLSAGGHQVLP